MSEVKRYYVGKYGLVEGEALGRLSVVLASDYDAAVTHIRQLELLAGQEMKSTELATNAGLRVCLERDALQALLTAADERADVLEGLLRLLAELPGVRASGMWQRVVDALKPAEAARCCTVSAEDRALLEAGDYTPEELFGVGGKPSCPKCAKP